MLERITGHVRRVLAMAEDECHELGSESLTPVHLLLGLSRDAVAAASAAVRSVGANHQDLRRQRGGTTAESSTRDGRQRPFSEDSKRVLELALREALQMGDEGIGTIAFLLGVLRVGDAQINRAFEALSIDADRLRSSAAEMKVLEAGELNEVAARLIAASDDHAPEAYDDPMGSVIAAFEGPIFAILSPDLGKPIAGGSSVGGGDLTQIGIQYDDVSGLTWKRLAYIETTFLDRIQGAVFLGGNPTPRQRERRLKEFMDKQRRGELNRPPAARFERILDYALNDEYGDRSEVVDVISTGTFELEIESTTTPVETWSAGPWSLGSFEGEFKGRLVGVKVGVNGFPVSHCTIGYVDDPRVLADI